MKAKSSTESGEHTPILINDVPESTPTNSIEWHGDGLLVHRLFLGDPEIVHLTKGREQEDMVRRLVSAATIGAKALNQSEQALDMSFVRLLMDQHTQNTTAAVSDLMTKTRSMMDDQFDGEKGKALEPIRLQVRNVEETVTHTLKEILEALDPTRSDSDLSKALAKLSSLLNEEHVNSVPSRIKTIVDRLAAQDGALATNMKGAVQDAIKTQIEPLCKQVRDLEIEIIKEKAGKEAADAVIQATTAKGSPFEEEVKRRVRLWATPFGGETLHTGTDNKPGDVVVDFKVSGPLGIDFRIVVEAKDDAMGRGRKPLQEAVTKALNYREAEAEVFVGKTIAAFAGEIGDWAEGTSEGRHWIACTLDYLPMALRYLVIMKRFRDRVSKESKIDSGAIEEQIQVIHTALRRITTIKTAATTITNGAAKMAAEGDALSREIGAALLHVEEMLIG
jgi:hypothetical protein